jgi:hypothetical protein
MWRMPGLPSSYRLPYLWLVIAEPAHLGEYTMDLARRISGR